MRILLMDCTYPLPGSERTSFASPISVYDYDVVFWDPHVTDRFYTGQYPNYYQGRPSLSEHASAKYVADVARRSREFKEFVGLGGTLVVTAREGKTFWVQTGEKKTSGTGRNEKVTNFVADVDLLSVLPFPYKALTGSGFEVQAVSPSVQRLWQATKDAWVYQCILEEYPGRPIFKVAGLEKVIGSLDVRSGGGSVVLLPELWVDDDDDDDDDEVDNEVEVDSDEAEADSPDLAQDRPDEDEGDNTDRMCAALLAFIASIREEDADALPGWCAVLKFPAQVARGHDMAALEVKIAKLAQKLDGLKLADAEDEKWKQLLASQGTVLERQVLEAFRLMGFVSLDTERGRSDLRLDLNGTRVVVEIKGLSKSAAEKNAAQLEKWVAEEMTDAVRAKGVLVVNGWRDVAPNLRKEVFPHQMLAYATAREHCLMTTTQLLVIARLIQGGELPANVPADSILATSGLLEGYGDLSAALETATVETAADVK